MKIKTLASGSKGNSTLIEFEHQYILIDLGIHYLPLKRMLENIKISPSDIQSILITHIHNDHIKGLAAFVKHTNCKVYVPKGIYDDLLDVIPDESMVIVEDEFDLGLFHIELIHTSHDVPCSVGYNITCQDKSLVYITDTGYLNRKYVRKLRNKDIYVIESNHDETMLMDGPYPYYLKQRVIGDKGHLSNIMVSRYLKEMIGEKTKYIVLAHLSEKNNTEELAKKTLEEHLQNHSNGDVMIYIAKQEEVGPSIEV